MHAFNPYRARVLQPSLHDTRGRDATMRGSSSSRQLRGQAALFDRYRQLIDAAQQDSDADAAASHVDHAPQAESGGSLSLSLKHADAIETASPHDGLSVYVPVDGFIPDLALVADARQDRQRDSLSPQQHEQDDERHGDRHNDSAQPPPAAGSPAAHAANGPKAAHAVLVGGVAGSRLIANPTLVDAIDAVAPHDPLGPPLVDYLVSTIDDFCSNSAVHTRGAWQLTIALDPQRLPECQLHLSLSHFDLTLRFETASNDSRQLISLHAAPLRVSLVSMLKQSAPDLTRSIEIIIY